VGQPNKQLQQTVMDKAPRHTRYRAAARRYQTVRAVYVTNAVSPLSFFEE
jgi:hypothetical protein